MAKVSKRKLDKLLGKELTYTGIFERVCNDKHRALILNVEHEGKEYADHIWVKQSQGLLNKKIGEKVKFKGVAYMYNDRLGTRKQGLHQCISYQSCDDHYEEAKTQDSVNFIHKLKRIYKKRR